MKKNKFVCKLVYLSSGQRNIGLKSAQRSKRTKKLSKLFPMETGPTRHFLRLATCCSECRKRQNKCACVCRK